MGAAMRYLSQRYAMPYNQCKAVLTDIGTEELAHLEIVAAIIHQLTRNLTPEEVTTGGFGPYYIDHTTGIWPQAAGGVPFNASEFQSKGDPITDLFEDMAAEQKARTTYDNILRVVKDPDVCDPIRYLREREIVHFQRFGEALRITQDQLDFRNFYAFNPAFDRPETQQPSIPSTPIEPSTPVPPATPPQDSTPSTPPQGNLPSMPELPDCEQLLMGGNQMTDSQNGAGQMTQNQMTQGQMAAEQMARTRMARNQAAQNQMTQNQIAQNQMAQTQIPQPQMTSQPQMTQPAARTPRPPVTPGQMTRNQMISNQSTRTPMTSNQASTGQTSMGQTQMGTQTNAQGNSSLTAGTQARSQGTASRSSGTQANHQAARMNCAGTCGQNMNCR